SSSLIILPPPRPPPFPYTTLFRSADRASIPPPVVSDRLAHDWGTWPGAAGASHAGLAGARTSDCSDEAAATATGMQPTPSRAEEDRKSTRLNSSHVSISYAVFCLK